MFVYFLAILLVYITWQVKDYFTFNVPRNVSKTSTPLMTTPINLAYMSQDEIFTYLRRNAEQFKGSYVSRFFGLWNFNVCRAEDAERILGSSKHVNKRNIYSFLNPFLKTGLLTSNGEKWHTRRRMLTPAFHFEILKEYLEVFREESDKLVSMLSAKEAKELNIVPIATQFTLNTMGHWNFWQVIFNRPMGVKLSDLGNNGLIYRENIYKVGELLLFRLLRPWLRPNFMYSLLGYSKQLDEVLKPVLKFTKSIVQQRKSNFVKGAIAGPFKETDENIYFRTKKRRYAMMDTLLQAENNGLIDDEGIIEETDTFTFEGHDTTSAAIIFTLLLLAHHPEAQETIFNEIKVLLETREELSIDDFSKLEYLDRVIKESLRIYPPVTFISRELSEDLSHDGFKQSKGSGCNIHIFDIHRDPEVFPDPEDFLPDRFLPENCAGRSNFAFIAFSAGMRNCIGQRFAMLELKMVFSKLIRHFKILPITKREEVVLLTDLVLRPKGPIKMKFILRNSIIYQ